MKRYYFLCKFLTDVVINATAATEGNNTSLDYIPGSAFLGIVAKDYKQFNEDAFNVFHNGKVRFSDGHPYQMGRSLKIPASLHLKKGDEFKFGSEIIQHHLISDDQREQFRADGIQLKQQRSGFIEFKNNTISKVESKKDFSIKSAYDRDNRRSKDAQMFGYESLKAGSMWSFYVELDEDCLPLFEKIKENLEGVKRLGRSKTAEFGLVEIQFESEKLADTIPVINSGSEVLIYAESSLVFTNEFGLPNLTPEAEDFGIAGNIDWGKSKMLTRSFAPYNNKRKTREADRVCIDKGSVFKIKVEGKIDYAKLERGVGLFLNEGFGKVLINPAFLLSETISIASNKQKDGEIPLPVAEIKVPEELKSNTLIQYLSNAAKEEETEFKILKDVDDFITANKSIYRKIKSSQWGGIRERAQRAGNKTQLMELIFGETSDNKINEEKGYLTHGVAASDWKERNRLDTLKEWAKGFDEHNCPTALIVLSAAMAKIDYSKQTK